MPQYTLPSTRAIAIVLGLALLTTVGVTIYFSDVRQGIIVGLQIAILGQVFELRHQIVDHAMAIRRFTNDALDRLISYLKLSEAFTPDDWLIKVMQQMAALKVSAEAQQYQLVRLRQHFEDTVTNASLNATQPWDIPIPTEMHRAIEMQRAIERAKKYVYAVTFNKERYVELFWEPGTIFTESYLATNRHAAAHGVSIHRIFVIDKAVLDGQGEAAAAHASLLATFEELKGLPNVTQRVVVLDNPALPDELRRAQTSFIVVDGEFASESDGSYAGELVKRYACAGDRQVVKKLEERFEQFKFFAKSLSMLSDKTRQK